MTEAETGEQLRGFGRRAAFRRWWIIGTAIVFSMGAGVWQQLSDKQYKATALVAIVNRDSARGMSLSAALGQLSPLASLAGIPGLGATQNFEPIAILESRFLTEKYVEDNQLLPTLFSRQWDASRRAWKTSDPERVPTPWKAYEKFTKKIRRVSQDAKTGLVSISITWNDPVIAARWANGLVAMTNEVLRRHALEDADKNIAYLTTQASTTQLMEVRTALTSLIEQELKRAMITRGADEYALRMIDPAAPPGEPTSPGLALASFAGLLAGLSVALLLTYLDWLVHMSAPARQDTRT